ncbi:hypothetical protein [Mucilaginibacter sp.]
MLTQLKSKPHHFLAYIGLLLVLLSLLPTKRVIDVNLHDTYYVIGYRVLLVCVAAVLLFLWLIALLLVPIETSRRLTLLHIVITIISVISLLLLTRRDATGINDAGYTVAARSNFILILPYLLSIIAFLVAQLIFVVHLGIAITKWILSRVK